MSNDIKPLLPELGSISLLGGNREGFHNPDSRTLIRLSKTVDFESEDFKTQVLPSLIQYHQSNILPRYNVLLRYYYGDNDIIYKETKPGFNVVDNKIASSKARYAVKFGVGYMYSEPVVFNNENYDCESAIDQFMKETNAHQYFTDMERQQLIFGTGFGLISMDGNTSPENIGGSIDGEIPIRQTLDALSPMNTFVVYDYSLRPQSLFAVTYNRVDDTKAYPDSKPYNMVNVYTPELDYVFSDESGDFEIVDVTINPYGSVRVTQWDNDPDRMGVYELALDQIDAYDISQSELANFQQISNSPLLLIKNAKYSSNTTVYKKDCDGNVTDEKDEIASQRAQAALEKQMMDANILAITDTVLNDGEGKSTVLGAEASYLVPVYDVAGIDAYTSRLERDIYDATMQPNISDESFSGNSSGVSLEYKLITTDASINMQLTQRRKSMMRELRLAYKVWSATSNISFNINDINATDIVFTLSNPGRLERQKDMISTLNGIVSDETMAELLTPITKVKSTDEVSRKYDN